ncbi:hypothetical protein BJ170DRAFT_419455 [Xylariales sp. AK1849]|nr:hypothetical protein BJ170DRAFT_419455 [Xylariales sp. AK1849]
MNPPAFPDHNQLNNSTMSPDSMTTPSVEVNGEYPAVEYSQEEIQYEWKGCFFQYPIPDVENLRSQGDGRYYCDWDRCPKSHSTARDMKTHMRPVCCPRCPWTDVHPRDMLRHLSTKHKTWAKNNDIIVDGFVCENESCGKYYTRKDNMKRHLKKCCYYAV